MESRAKNRNKHSSFARLPVEIRTKIWAETWPEPRIIEVRELWSSSQHETQRQGPQRILDESETASCRSLDHSEDGNRELNDEGSFYLGLQLTSSFSSWMQHDFGHRVTEDEPLEECPPPISLQICRESRAFTLQHFVRIKDSISPSRSFYFSPRRDILCLSRDIVETGAEEVEEAGCCYGAQLNLIQSSLVELYDWNEAMGPAYCFKFLHRFKGIKLVRVLLESEEYDGFEGYRVRELAVQAGQRKIKDEALLQGLAFPWTVEYVDRTGNVHARLYPGRRL
ncbi:hypothetical protein TOPH_08046 [Tolypocladium ophioglossoides CBS 100239]|uniref:2EXR domain-containing protein n=1 Tax=Tolypocladium ophioglossoides (strain CBS 100239) TaxID=1163406 RepID=A0A0L0MZU0_TOLOC|nr:hypothetical protein TOPH_08046 [Tolypocladium ophioglossoides CBS 100239]